MADVDYDEILRQLLENVFRSLYSGDKIDEIIGTVIANKDAWSGKYSLPSGGIPASDLAQPVQEALQRALAAIVETPDLTGYATDANLSAHTANSGIHVTSTDKNNWNGKYSLPQGGIPLGDLATAIQTAINAASTAVQPETLVEQTQPKISETSSLPTSGTALTANTIYNVTSPVGRYTFVAPESKGWAHGFFTTISYGTVDIQFGNGAKFVGGVKPTTAKSTQYEFDVYDNQWAFAEVKT